MVKDSLYFLIGISLLVGGSKLLVHGALKIAYRYKISSLIIGLTVVAFGTSAPEIAFCSLAAWRGEGDLLMGNLVGSNILNILLVLGLGATLTPLFVKKQLIWWDVPIMIAASFLVWGLAAFGMLYLWQGVILLVCLALYLCYLYWMQKRASSPKTPDTIEAKKISLPLQLLWIVAGIGLLWVGSVLLIEGATGIARTLGVGELLIGLTLVALGTSVPEIATTFTALQKKDKDLAVGNVIGSNLFNLLAVLGIALIVSPSPLVISREVLLFDLPVMVAVGVAALPIFITGHVISRWEGMLFLLYYGLYITYLILNAYAHPLLDLLTSAILFFILPLTLITLAIGVVRHLSSKSK